MDQSSVSAAVRRLFEASPPSVEHSSHDVIAASNVSGVATIAEALKVLSDLNSERSRFVYSIAFHLDRPTPCAVLECRRKTPTAERDRSDSQH